MIALMLFIFSMNGHAQLDVTNLVLKNAGFDENIMFKASDVLTLTTSYNNPGYDYYQMQDVEGWDHALDTSSGINACGATFEFSSQSTINNQLPPETNYDGLAVGGCLGFSGGWTSQVGYAQSMMLPPGTYKLEYACFNNNSGASAGTSLAGWIPDIGTAAMSSKNSFTFGVWETDAINFVLSDGATGKIQLGLGASNVSSNSIAKIFIDWVTLTCTLDRTALQTIFDMGNTLYDSGLVLNPEELRAVLDAYQAVVGEPDDSPTLFIAAMNMCSVVKYAKAITDLLDLLDEAEALINNYNPIYSKPALDILEMVYEAASEAYDKGTLTASNIQTYVDQLRMSIENYKASVIGLKIHYTFNDVNGNVVANAPDATAAAVGVNYDGTLNNDASVVKMGKYNVLSLGNGTGYLDMGPAVGYVFPTASDFSVSLYYRVDQGASLVGDGYFLWSFATSNACSASVGAYAAYRLNAQLYMLTANGYNLEEKVQPDGGGAAAKGYWQHLVYTQSAAEGGKLYINGSLAATLETISLPSDVFATASPIYNWIGKSPFTSDNYLKNTLVYDFRFYNQVVPDFQITEWASLVDDLENEYNFGSVGDFSQLSALIAEYNSILANTTIGDGAGEFPQTAVWDLEDAIAVAQSLVTDNKASQFLIDEQIAVLKAAYNTFLSSVSSVIVYPADAGEAPYHFESGLYYIQVGNYYLTMPENGVNNTYLQLRTYIDNEDKEHNNQVWNIQFNYGYADMTLDPPQAVFSFVSDVGVWDEDGAWHLDEIGRMKEGDTPTAQSPDNGNWDWREHWIYFNGDKYSIVNHNNGRALVFANETENEQPQSLSSKKFNFVFRTIDDVVANPTVVQTLKATGKAIISGNHGEIVVSETGAGDKIEVYNLMGRLVKTSRAGSVENRFSVAPGIYIVRVSGETPTVSKVIVR